MSMAIVCMVNSTEIQTGNVTGTSPPRSDECGELETKAPSYEVNSYSTSGLHKWTPIFSSDVS